MLLEFRGVNNGRPGGDEGVVSGRKKGDDLITARPIAGGVALVILAISCVRVSTEWPTKHWPTATPVSVGLDAEVLEALDTEIAAGTHGYVDSMLVIRHGRIVYDRSYAHDYDTIYAEQIRDPGPLSLDDPTVPYN